jgi:tRNA(His) 5'-end guanylyltransferase
MSEDALGDRMKLFEGREVGRRLMPLLPILARIDGRCFSAFTRGLARPYDERLTDLMVATATYLVKETGAVMSYTQSDELTLAWHSTSLASQVFFDGRLQKMVSVLASLTTAFFNQQLTNFLPEEYARKLPHFDCRVWSVPSREEATNCFLWREWDATKNAIQMAAQAKFSHKQLLNKNGADMQEMLWQVGVNFNDYPAFFKRGSFVQRQKVVRAFTTDELEKLPPRHEARRSPALTVERSDYARLDMPPFARVTNRVAVVFDGAAPLLAQVEEKP